VRHPEDILKDLDNKFLQLFDLVKRARSLLLKKDQ
jgi:hypothetical protein